MTWTIWVCLGSLFAACGVGFGAFGAHALKESMSPEYLLVFETAVRYQMYHALALLAVGLVALRVDSLCITIAGVSFVAGIFLFSGSLYALTLTGHRMLGMITPVGGVMFMIGWLALAWAAFRP